MMDVQKLFGPYAITRIDPWLEPHAGDIELRMDRFKGKRWQLVEGAETLADFANGHLLTVAKLREYGKGIADAMMHLTLQ